MPKRLLPPLAVGGWWGAAAATRQVQSDGTCFHPLETNSAAEKRAGDAFPREPHLVSRIYARNDRVTVA